MCLNIIDLGFKVLYELPKWLIGFISGCSRVGIPSEGREACACALVGGRERAREGSESSFFLEYFAFHSSPSLLTRLNSTL